MAQRSSFRDWLGIPALIICLVLWLEICRSFFIRAYNESMLDKVFLHSLHLAPDAYGASLLAAVVKRLSGRPDFGMAELALLGSLLPLGTLASYSLPYRLLDSSTLADACSIAAVVLPTVVALVVCRYARRFYNKRHAMEE